MLIRTRRYYDIQELIVLYKAHMLSFIEYRTPAVYHATRDVLCKLDRVQGRFLEFAGIDAVNALLQFNLSPLQTWRDIAMLGLLHWTTLEKGADALQRQFQSNA